MRTARRFHRIWVLLIATTLATPACYTLLKHPNVDMTASEVASENRCLSCHSEHDLYVLLEPPTHPPYPPYEPIPVPWWWEFAWSIEQDGPSALRGFRPDGKDLGGAIEGPNPLNPPPGKVVGGDSRVRDPDDKKGEKHDEDIHDDGGTGRGDRDANKDKENKNPVRPKSKKGKEDG